MMRAGIGKSDLTPPLGVELAGYGYYLQRRAESVCDRLYAHALMLENDTGARALIISCDLLGLSRAVCDEVKRRVSAMGCAPEAVMLVSIHTHSGPCVVYHEGCGYPDGAYVSTVAERICAAVQAALNDMSEVTALEQRCADVPGDYIYNRAAPNGPVDHMARTFTLKRRSARPIAIVSAACHGVFRGRTTAISADFAGEIYRLLEQEGYDGLYLNGVCGDIDPWRPSPERLCAYARLLADVIHMPGHALPLTFSAGALPFRLRLCHTTAEEIRFAAAEAVRRAGGKEKPSARVARIWEDEMLAQLDMLSDCEELQCRYVLLGGVPIVALPFEGFTMIGQTIREIIARPDALVLGCAEQLLGYLPTRDDIDRGAYAALESTFLYKRLPVVPGEAERLGEEMAHALKGIIT